MLQRGPSVHTRHGEVEDYRARQQLCGLVDAAAAVGGGEGNPSFGVQILRVHLAGIEVVINNEYCRRLDGQSAVRGRHLCLSRPEKRVVSRAPATDLPATISR